MSIGAAFLLYFGIQYLKGLSLFSPQARYYVRYASTDELDISNPVTINGYVVGRVSRIEIEPLRNYTMLVELSVDGEIPLYKGVIAELQSSSILGGKTIALLMVDSVLDREILLHSGDTLRGRKKRTITDFLDETKMGDDIASSTRRINEILTGMEGSGLVLLRSLQQIDTLTSSMSTFFLSDNERGFRGFLVRINDIAKNVEYLTLRLDSILYYTQSKVEEIDISGINRTISDASLAFSSLDTLLLSVDRGEGSLGRLFREDSLYVNANNALRDLSILLRHFNAYPRDFVRPLGRSGKKIRRRNEKRKKEEGRED